MAEEEVQPTTTRKHTGPMGKEPEYWQCRTCSQRLAVLNDDRSELQVKYKDLYLYVRGGRVRTVCRKCGTWNEINDTTDVVDPSPDAQTDTKVR